MPAVRTSVRACCLALLWLCTALPAEAHTLITVTLEMVAEGDELTINLSVSPLDIIACLAPQSPSTRGQLRALGPQLGPYLLGHLAVSADGVVLGGAYAGYLPDLLQPGVAIDNAEALPTKLSFVLTWKLPAPAARLQVGLTLFNEERLPGFSQLVLESGAGHKRQVAYVELGKAWTFSLHGGGEAQPPMPPALAPAPIPGGTPPAAPTISQPGPPPSFALLVGRGLGALIGWFPLLLVVLLVALQPGTLHAVLLQAAVFALAQLVGLGWSAGRGEIPGEAVAALWAAGSVCALAVGNLSARPAARATPRLLLLAALGLLQGWALSGAARAADAVQDGVPGLLLGFALGTAIGEAGMLCLAVGTTAWTWGSDRHRRYVVIPASLVAALLALLWLAGRMLAHLPVAG